MSRLDRHIAIVQSKLALRQFMQALVYTALIFIGAVWLGIVVQRIVQVSPPRPGAFVWGAAGIAVLAALIWSLFRKPTALQAAVAIDAQLSLKEKFSTALQFRQSGDPFAAAAVKDAERTAENISLHRQFPLQTPRLLPWLISAGIVLLCTAYFLPKDIDLFGREAQRRQLATQEAKRQDALKTVQQALATVNSYPKSLQSDQAIQMAKKDLESLLNQPIKDPAQTSRTAFKALEQANDAVKEEIKKSDQFALAQTDQKMMRSLEPTPDEHGPVADAQRAIAKGDFSQAMDHLEEVAQKFDKMSDEQKKQAAAQMDNLAKQLQQMAQNPAQQQQLQQQLQKQGVPPQQAQQLQKLMQQAAQGNQQAQQQLQQMQQQMMAKMTPQQQQSAQQMMKQMQAQANSQQTAQQMSQAAQQMAQAMQKASQQPGQQQQNQQQGQQQSQMAQAQQQMQEALGQMDAVQKDAQQMSAAQDATAQAQADAGGQGNGHPGKGDNGKSDSKGSDKTGQWQAGDPNGHPGNGMGGPGQGNGGRAQKEQAPYTIKKELAPTQDLENGKILASTFVKAGTVKGESKVELSKAAESAMKDAPDEVDEEAVSKESQKVVKEYFETMQKGE